MGKFIVIEGMDGAGTTTQSKLLAEVLRKLGYSVETSAEPTKSAIGMEARRILKLSIEHEPAQLATLALLFAADRMNHIHSLLNPALKNNDFVIVDRYVLSSLVYQGLHLPAAFVQEINRFSLNPDLTIVLDIDAKKAISRLSARGGPKDFYESGELLEKIRARYLHFAEKLPDTALVDGEGAISAVHSHILHLVRSKFL